MVCIQEWRSKDLEGLGTKLIPFNIENAHLEAMSSNFRGYQTDRQMDISDAWVTFATENIDVETKSVLCISLFERKIFLWLKLGTKKANLKMKVNKNPLFETIRISFIVWKKILRKERQENESQKEGFQLLSRVH